MGHTDSFRKQHDEILAIVKDLMGLLNTDALKKDALKASDCLNKITGKIKLHLAMEDQSLYPSLLNHKDATVKSVATKFNGEMGNILPVYEGYAKKWMLASAIQADPSTFIKETKEVFGVLGNRIDKENNELYNLVDKVA